MEGKVNGWRYYRNSSHGKMVAYYPNTEQLVFDSDEAFGRWLKEERKECLEILIGRTVVEVDESAIYFDDDTYILLNDFEIKEIRNKKGEQD